MSRLTILPADWLVVPWAAALLLLAMALTKALPAI